PREPRDLRPDTGSSAMTYLDHSRTKPPTPFRRTSTTAAILGSDARTAAAVHCQPYPRTCQRTPRFCRLALHETHSQPLHEGLKRGGKEERGEKVDLAQA